MARIFAKYLQVWYNINMKYRSGAEQSRHSLLGFEPHREAWLWAGGTIAVFGAAIGLSFLPDPPPEPELLEDNPAVVSSVYEPHRETNLAYPGGITEYVPGEVHVQQCDPPQSPDPECQTFRIIIEDRDQFHDAVTMASISEGDIIVPRELLGGNGG